MFWVLFPRNSSRIFSSLWKMPFWQQTWCCSLTTEQSLKRLLRTTNSVGVFLSTGNVKNLFVKVHTSVSRNCIQNSKLIFSLRTKDHDVVVRTRNVNLSSEISCAKNHRWYLEANRGVPFQETCASYFDDCVWPLHLCQTLVHSSCFRQEGVWRILPTSAYLLFFYSHSNAILFMQCMTLLCLPCYFGIKILPLPHIHKFLLKVRYNFEVHSSMYQLRASNRRNESMNSPSKQIVLRLLIINPPPPHHVFSHISLKSCAHSGHLMQTRLLNV